MVGKILKTARGKWALVLLIVAILGVAMSVSTNDWAVDTIGSLAIIVIVAVILMVSAIQTIKATPADMWAKKWSAIPLNDAQARRLLRGVEVGFTPKSINLDTKSAVIVGSKGRTYKTTLTKCTCPDFKERKVPCKHMYYLAVETGALDADTIEKAIQ